MRVTPIPVLILSCTVVLGACTLGDEPEYLAPTPDQNATELVARDIEAPEVFQLTELGQWDGNPSLGGVWATHPSAQGTQRVIIRNPENNRFVVGSLFAQNAAPDGPALQVSSDAAAALGLLALTPTPLNVTALRQVTGDEPVPAPPAPMGVETTAITPAPAAPPAEPTSSSLTRPFIQVGTFSVRSNAQAVVDQLNTAGIPARLRDDTARGAPVFGVLAGPANSSVERDDILTKVKAQGFADAYPVKG